MDPNTYLLTDNGFPVYPFRVPLVNIMVFRGDDINTYVRMNVAVKLLVQFRYLLRLVQQYTMAKFSSTLLEFPIFHPRSSIAL